MENEEHDYTLYLFWKTRNCKSHYRKINLIIYTDNGQTHCYLIKSDFTIFINNFASLRFKKNETLCNYCFQKFDDRLKLVEHKLNLCVPLKDDVQMKYPKEGTFKKFSQPPILTKLLKLNDFTVATPNDKFAMKK